MGRRQKVFKFRTLIIALFAVMGSVVGGWLMPFLIQLIFDATIDHSNRPTAARPETIAASALFGLLAGAGIGSLMLVLFGRLQTKWNRMHSGDKVTLFLGFFAGLLITLPFLNLLGALLPAIWVAIATVPMIVGLSALSIFALSTMGDVLPWNKGKGRGKRTGIKILDTNVIIDGRIYDVIRTGFLDGPLYVPGFVVDELQYIADSPDMLRRQRGRRGLDVLLRLQAETVLEVRVHDKHSPPTGNDDVDARLVRLAKHLGADIVTNDFNLNRVASLQEVKVLNVNDLALALRPNVLPQETVELTLIREGNQFGQGVGYLDDGTMVVVEGGRAHIGETLGVVVTQLIQTERGRMIFAEVNGQEEESDPSSGRRRTPRRGH